MAGTLYLVATPIGNLNDITLRAINVLKSVDIVVPQKKKKSLKLLNHLRISKPLMSYYRHKEEVKYEKILEKIKEGKNIAIISDAGTPIISDPGEVIVKAAIKENIEVIPIPGACAAITALMAGGVDTKKFVFYGFISINKKLRKKELEEINDLFAMKIIVDSKSYCYIAMGILMEYYQFIPLTFKDYISIPRENMYQALQSILIGEEGIIFKVKICNQIMNEISKNGILAYLKSYEKDVYFMTGC